MSKAIEEFEVKLRTALQITLVKMSWHSLRSSSATVPIVDQAHRPLLTQ